ncbi:heme lyase CcmF/NrfE family subunit [Thermoleophilum album]|uniref:Cytochrome c-type biogenesis protein CcmF n=1 Tax=Thermoleophilum album TaxID=29539 RepID=A0A1H6FZN2_THEAL|nr:heme lyase CcmF/NrfE family subunit [Thermoleophilum album]SEH15770.1 cytochrome c-type biogenesis protein CcmF [Thermoleophilum album]
MAPIGSGILLAGLLVALVGVALGVLAARSGDAAALTAARRAIYALAALLVAAFALAEIAYLRADFGLAMVAESSSRDTPTFYKLTAIWSTQEGSLLLWVTLLAIYSSLALRLARGRMPQATPRAIALLAGLASFFLALMVIWESPFTRLSPVPPDGSGLNPLLRHPAMMFHPPLLYSGYVGFSIPFAFCVGALLAKRAGPEWIATTRRFALAAWAFLSAGILAGALWSYGELGWGGYWAWDPVENASLLPWLTGTALIHSVMVQERRRMFAVWNASLVCGTFVLCLTGTFLVRSGVLSSIHAFGASTVGVQFLALIAVTAAFSGWLVASRAPLLRAPARIESWLSREALFLANNVLLVGLAGIVLWGTFFPIVSEALSGRRASLGPPWFAQATRPLAIALVLVTALGTAAAWRRIRPRALLVALAPGLALVVVALVVGAATGLFARPAAAAMVAVCSLLAGVVASELVRGTAARARMRGERLPVALARLVARNRRRYGGFLVHAGVAVLLLGVAVSSSFPEQRDVRLRPGDRVQVGGYTIRYLAPTASILRDPARTGAPVVLGARLAVTRGRDRELLEPARNFYPARTGTAGPIESFFGGEATSEIALRSSLTHDLWIAFRPDVDGLVQVARALDRRLREPTPMQQLRAIAALAEIYRRDPPPATFRVIVSPLVAWIWIGGGIGLAGALLALWPRTRRPVVDAHRRARVRGLAEQPSPYPVVDSGATAVTPLTSSADTPYAALAASRASAESLQQRGD